MLNVCFSGGERTLLRLALPNEEVTYGYEDLDWGRIHPNDFDVSREEVIDKSFAFCSESEKKQMIEEARERHRSIITAAKKHQDLRIWCSSNSASLCGLLYVVYSLKGIDCRIFIVDMPNDIGCLPLEYDRSWAEAEPCDVEPCLSLQREITEPERQVYEQAWERYIRENAELRINLNGRLTSVDVHYFDDEILSYAPIGEDFLLGNLVGMSLQIPRYLNPSFVEDRIEAMITQGRIAVVERNADPEYNNLTVLRIESY